MSENVTETLSKVLDKAADVWEDKTSTQTSRTGNVAARVASALANEVDPAVIALQMSMNSKKANPQAPVNFTATDVKTIGKLFEANKTRSVLPKHQTGALIREQKAADTDPVPGGNGGAPAPA